MLEKWVYLALGGLIIYANYFLIHVTVIDDKTKKSPTHKSNHRYRQHVVRGNHQGEKKVPKESENLCCNPFYCSLNGEWILKENVGFKELNRVLDTNMRLRMRKGWPTNLYHGDMRCGKKYPLPRIIRFNNTESYYLDISSQCDSQSNAPCCRDDIGWCGRGDSFCKCSTCTDYERLIHAELYEWNVKVKGCNMKTFSSAEACEYLQSAFTSVTFIGDSLVRHVFSALLLYLTDDPLNGALKPALSTINKNYCKGENQFVDSSCHSKLATKWEEISNNEMYCSSNKRKVKVSFVQAYSTSLYPLAGRAIQKILSDPRPLILLGIGVHDNFNASKVITNYLKPIFDTRKHYNNSNPLFIWLNTHAAGPLKPLIFQDTQGNEIIEKFNEQLRQFCRNNSVMVFDSYNITKGVHSFDGTHYGSSINKLKIKLLLYGLSELDKDLKLI